jgi:hypothetical protein
MQMQYLPNAQKRKYISLLIIILTSYSVIRTDLMSRAETDIPSLTIIDNKINQAFEKILEAENEGADIRDLLDKINRANELYQEIKIAIQEGDSEKISTSAHECEILSSQITNEANQLSLSASEQKRMQVKNRTLIVRVAFIAILVTSLLLWTFLKKYHRNQLLQMRPRVVSDEP